MRDNSFRGFTYIEVLIALAVMAILFIPMMQLFSRSLYSTTISGDMLTAVNLARWEMERVKNLNITKNQLKLQGNIWTPKLEEQPLTINNAKWRILRHLKADSDPLQVNVEVYLADNLKKPLATLVALIEDNIWVEKKQEIE